MDKKKIIKDMKDAINKVRKKNAIDDVLDSNNMAEMSSDSLPSSKQGTMSKKDEDCNCKGEKDCECDDIPMDKAEQVVKSIINNFKKISDAYLAKKEGRCWEGYEPTPGKKAYSEGSCQKKNEISDEPTMHPGKGQVSTDTQKKVKNIIDINQKLREKNKIREKNKAKRVKTAQETAKKLKDVGIEPKFDPMAASEKPFHGYNKEKHSREGGLSEKERNRINRETGSNLKAPVSSKEAKKSPKKAARRKSFCARMSGNKGPTSKDGKLTPKGAALKRWDC